MGLQPLDFRRTLDLLGSWEGRSVLVTAHGQAGREALSHSHAVLRGPLGSLEMVDNDLDPNIESAAGYAVGDAPNGLYMTATDFVRAVRAGASHLTVQFRNGLYFEVHRLD